jgi:hypothetical protein
MCRVKTICDSCCFFVGHYNAADFAKASVTIAASMRSASVREFINAITNDPALIIHSALKAVSATPPVRVALVPLFVIGIAASPKESQCFVPPHPPAYLI